jgi:hypothetical protein
MKIREDEDFITFQVSPESMDAHLQCLRENGYAVNKKSYLVATTIMCVLFGMFVALTCVKYGI